MVGCIRNYIPYRLSVFKFPFSSPSYSGSALDGLWSVALNFKFTFNFLPNFNWELALKKQVFWTFSSYPTKTAWFIRMWNNISDFKFCEDCTGHDFPNQEAHYGRHNCGPFMLRTKSDLEYMELRDWFNQLYRLLTENLPSFSDIHLALSVSALFSTFSRNKSSSPIRSFLLSNIVFSDADSKMAFLHWHLWIHIPNPPFWSIFGIDVKTDV